MGFIHGIFDISLLNLFMIFVAFINEIHSYNLFVISHDIYFLEVIY